MLCTDARGHWARNDGREYCHRIGSQWIGFPAWQRGASHERDKLVLSKAEKKCAGLLRDLMKRKGGTFFEFAVDPSTEGSGELDDYFTKVCVACTLNTERVCESTGHNRFPRSHIPP